MPPSKRKTKRKRVYSVSRAGVGGRKRRDDSGPGRALYCRTTAAEYATITTGALAAGWTVPDFVRAAALEAARKALANAGLQESSQGLSISVE